MCWVACDQLAKIAVRLKLTEEAKRWRGGCGHDPREICKRAWNAEKKSFVSTFGGDQLDASLLLLNELHFLEADDPRFAATVAAVERELKRGEFVFRYIEEDDFGPPRTPSSSARSGWWMRWRPWAGATRRSRSSSASCAAQSPRHARRALRSQDRRALGNFPQTYSHVGMINSAMRLSISWDDAY
jgi:GH15 family glucan-1,4-alpha-glucosidase